MANNVFYCKKIIDFRLQSKFLTNNLKEIDECRKFTKIPFHGNFQWIRQAWKTPKNKVTFHHWYSNRGNLTYFHEIHFNKIWASKKKFKSVNVLRRKLFQCSPSAAIVKIQLNYWYHSLNSVLHFELLLSIHRNFKKIQFSNDFFGFYFLFILASAANIFIKILFSFVHRIEIIKYLCLAQFSFEF